MELGCGWRVGLGTRQVRRRRGTSSEPGESGSEIGHSSDPNAPRYQDATGVSTSVNRPAAIGSAAPGTKMRISYVPAPQASRSWLVGTANLKLTRVALATIPCVDGRWTTVPSSMRTISTRIVSTPGAAASWTE